MDEIIMWLMQNLMPSMLGAAGRRGMGSVLSGRAHPGQMEWGAGVTPGSASDKMTPNPGGPSIMGAGRRPSAGGSVERPASTGFTSLSPSPMNQLQAAMSGQGRRPSPITYV